MTKEIQAMLTEEVISPLHKALLDEVEKQLKAARGKMSEHYAGWDMRSDVYMRRRPFTKDDAEAIKQDLPKKIVVPLSYSQINTFVAFGFMLFTQKDRFIELTATADEDQGMKECCELVLQRDQEASNYKSRLVQNLLNVGRFGMGVEVDWWETDTVWVPISTQGEAPTYQGAPTGDAPVITKLEKVTKREGTCIRTISPYRFFPDPGFHPTEWQRGNFIGWDDEFTRNALIGLEDNQVVAGVKWIKDYTMDRWTAMGRTNARFSGINPKAFEKSSTICVTQLVINLNPSKIKGPTGPALGDDTVPHKWLIWVANDQRVIRAEALTNLHAQWPASVSFFAPDQHETVFNSLAYMIDDLQGLVSWCMNSRMAAVTRMIDGQAVVDPLGINVDDIVARKRLIRLTKQGSNKDVRRFYNQLQTQDSTQGHVADMSNLTSMMQLVSGVNDNAMGQYNGGRRSATEARSVMSGASARMKMVFDVMWSMHYQPQANRCLINARQAMSPEEFMAVCGPVKAQQYYPQFHPEDPRTLVRSYDYIAFDGTQQSEKQFIAQQLMEVFSLLMSNPETAATFNMDPGKVLIEIMELRGLGSGTNFAFDPQMRQAILQQAMIAQQPTQEGPPP